MILGKDQAKEIGFQEERVVGYNNFKAQDNSWVIMESCDDHDHENLISESSMELENSINSVASISSSLADLVEDASSSSLSSSSSSSKSLSSSSSISFSPPNSTSNNGPLYELSELMVHLPLRRGLSKFYQGKSQSFTSLASVKSSEDLPKKVAIFRKKIMKPCKSLRSPKPIIAKKSPRASSFLSSHHHHLASFRPNSVPMQNN